MLGTVQETESILHRILTPPLIHGELLELAPEGDYTIDEVIGRVKLADGRIEKLHLFHRWPVRTPRPFKQRDHAVAPLITGQRILDTFYPLLKGGKAAIPGPFGAGKTMLQQQIARWCNAEIVIYVGCGERGNELTDVLEFMPELKDPHTGRPLMERTLLVANTSNMPVVAREASIYVGITLAEYFRDQGYDVVMVADSTSRWAEALREVAGRLGPDAGGGGLSGLSRLAPRRLLRARRAGGNARRRPWFGDPDRRGVAARRRLLRARHQPHQGNHPDLLGAVEGTRRRAPLPGGGLAGKLLRLREFRREVVGAKTLIRTGKAARAEALDLLAASEELQRIVNLVGVEALSSEQRWTLEAAGPDQGRPAAAGGHR